MFSLGACLQFSLRCTELMKKSIPTNPRVHYVVSPPVSAKCVIYVCRIMSLCLIRQHIFLSQMTKSDAL